MYHAFLALNFSKRIIIFVVVAATFSYLVLLASIKVGYPNGATPQLDSYCCSYCEHQAACVSAAIGFEKDDEPAQLTGDQACCVCDHPKGCACENDNQEVEIKKGRSIPVPIAPFDTWTNIAYLVIGLLPFAQRIQTSTVTILFSVFSISLGLGSGLFHAGGSYTGQIADMLGVFAIFGLLGANAIQVLLKQKNDLLVIVLIIILTLLQFYLREYQSNTVALLTIGVIIVVPLLIRGNSKSMRLKVLASMVFFAIAETFRQLDPYLCYSVAEEALFFGRKSLIQAHGLWHMVSAIGIGYVFWVEQEIMDEAQNARNIEGKASVSG